ncbi:Putative ABC transporter permease [Croceitalea dokdonensis DOKDO 023]|uniref:Putative ABC transporter permease n=1 Tax=Croceitalea dokdonensis DOKDO 023 TaxID=1300341 RepID=A0A0P7ASB9_9FLAO|nr:ABC transporter permease [Croceitalea dokdonensis]KPM30837.1 Putative ABC transporter permease [Croceitalea dokdonensis DOKDO 023]
MLKNHIKISLRNLWKNKTLSLLNLVGLSIGVASVLTLLFSVYAYYTADNPIPNKENIVYLKTILEDGNDYREAPYPLLDKVVNTSPDVIAGTHLHGWGNIWLEHGEKEFQHRTDYAEPEFFEVFELPLKYGNQETALKEKYSIILTEKVSRQIFGDTNPVGKTLIGADTLNLKITGVFEPISPYSSFRLGVVLPNTLLKDNPTFIKQTDWSNSFSPVYFKLRPDANRANLKTLINQLVQENYSDPSLIAGLEVMPFTEMRTDIIPVVDTIIGGSIAASFFVLLIILVNLLNLNSSTMLRRTKDIAVRKVLGSSKKNVVVQFCIENGILVFVSIIISLVLFLLVNLPRLNNTFGAEFGRISFDLTKDYPVIVGIVVVGVLATLMVGILPTLRFIKVPVSLGIKGKMNQIKNNFLLRNSFIILQFTIAILFISIAVILNQQIGFMKNADLGFERHHVLVGNIDLDYKDLDAAKSKFNALINDLEANPYVQSVATSEGVPSDYYFNYTTYSDLETKTDVRFRRSYADDGYFEALEVPIAMGRNFDRNRDNLKEYPVIINEAGMKAFGWTSIEGKRLKFKVSDDEGHPIVGVIKDFHYQDLQNAVEPLVHIYRDKSALNRHRFLSVKVVEGQEQQISNMITAAFNGISSRRGYEQLQLNDKVSAQYQLIDGILKSVNVTAIITIFISCLGMFGLISFLAKRKVKEIGIRKVLGAGVAKIVVLLSKDYIILVGIAAIIAFPIAWYAMNVWLGTFAYSISISWWMFAVAGLIAFCITAFTLGLQAVKSAMANPVKSLRTE